MVIWQLLLLLSFVFVGLGERLARLPGPKECGKQVATGSCNDPAVWDFCKKACREDQRLTLMESYGQGSRMSSVYDLSATDIDGNNVSFQDFKGKVLLIVNVASYCGFTETHYKQMIQLHDAFNRNGDEFEILAFPCNQFGSQEPDPEDEIKGFCSAIGVRFRMMEKINVNGHDTHPVYRFLKQTAGPSRTIEWNFGTYYLVSREGEVSSHSGVEPFGLIKTITMLVHGS